MLPVTHHSGARPAGLSSHPVVWSGRRGSFGLVKSKTYFSAAPIRFHNPFTLTVAHGGGEQDGLGTASDSGCSLQDSPVPTPPSSSGKLSPHPRRVHDGRRPPTVSISGKSTRLMLLLLAASAGTRSDRRRGDQGDVKPRKWLVGDHGGKNPPSADPSYLPGRTGRVSCRWQYRINGTNVKYPFE